MKEGDKVKLNIKSQHYIPKSHDPFHPKNTVGEIYHIGGDDLIFVEWPDGRKSVYSPFDLDLQWDLTDLPKLGCTCTSWDIFHYGCKCIGGQEELEKERK